jgi:hypothetical protein
MNGLIEHIPPSDLAAFAFFLISFGLAAVVTLVVMVAYFWSKVRRAEADAVLKQEMIQRGMGADEIERVLRASSAPPEPPAPARDNTPTGLAEVLTDQSYEGDDIAAVLKAVGERGAPLTPEEFAVVCKMAEGGYEGDDIVATIRALPRAVAASAAPAPQTVDGVVPHGFVGLGAVIVSKNRPGQVAAPTAP